MTDVWDGTVNGCVVYLLSVIASDRELWVYATVVKLNLYDREGETRFAGTRHDGLFEGYTSRIYVIYPCV